MTIRDRLENMLIDKGLIVDLLWGVQGEWRKTYMDVMRWEANCRRAETGYFVYIGSWYTMTECVRRGFELHQESEPWNMQIVLNQQNQPVKRKRGAK
jgi:hypothetical protein